ncbi:hypothetical protein GUA87_08745 [Sneathiella sp. P13V-1]|uniref:ubiquinol-cytochrome C chaperone family protein n=1 Tax=Sneathiella sp. P13V-1 TaxID=2697366 RepID=UPI00187B3C2C|nr:ubiquinol-cytochrome C chaperone family protein [Sneathiella sp. P13V-1]MBE7636931.1 hypothetical protein [Sneathiella sp. P13V-1]
MILKKLFGPKQEVISAEKIYQSVVSQARTPQFYLEVAVPDTIDGRYEMIALHCFLVLRRLKKSGSKFQTLSQEVFDLMFQDMDQSLREIGVGDLAVGKRIKKMAEVFYGRIIAYEEALEGGEETLEAALERNHYGTLEVAPQPEILTRMADYVRENDAFLAAIDDAKLEIGEVSFSSLQ